MAENKSHQLALHLHFNGVSGAKNSFPVEIHLRIVAFKISKANSIRKG